MKKKRKRERRYVKVYVEYKGIEYYVQFYGHKGRKPDVGRDNDSVCLTEYDRIQIIQMAKAIEPIYDIMAE